MGLRSVAVLVESERDGLCAISWCGLEGIFKAGESRVPTRLLPTPTLESLLEKRPSGGGIQNAFMDPLPDAPGLVKVLARPGVAYPLHGNGRRIGLLWIGELLPKGEQERVRIIADQAAIALWGALLHQERERFGRSRQRLLLDAIRNVSLNLSRARRTDAGVDDVIRTVIEGIRDGLGFERVGVFLVDHRTGKIRGTLGINHEGRIVPIKDATISLDDTTAPLVRLCLGQEESNRVSPQSWRRAARMGMDAPVSAVVGVSLKAHNFCIGAITVDNFFSNRAMSQDDVELLKLFADYAGIVIENALLYERVEQETVIDGLTGLHNHRSFLAKLDGLVAESQQTGQPVSLIMLDVDSFKRVNDEQGYACGDKLLVDVASAVRGALRVDDFLARYGGDEFVVLLPQTSEATALQVADRIEKTVTRYPFKSPSDEALPITKVTLGVACYPCHATGSKGLIRAAKAALLDAEHVRHNTAQVYFSVLDQWASHAQKDAEFLSIVRALAEITERKDGYTAGHCERLLRYAVALGQATGLSHEELDVLAAGALLHDIGKLEISDNILRKEGTLTSSEWAVVKLHPRIGAEMLRPIRALQDVIPTVLHHHERYDGKGYPDGLAGEQIPLHARIVALVDSYDAMTSKRPYNRRMLKEEAIAEIQQCAGRQFDPRLADRFIAWLAEGEDR